MSEHNSDNSLPSTSPPQKSDVIGKGALEILEHPSKEALRNNMESAIYTCAKQDPYLASLLQELNIKYDERIPTACVGFDKRSKTFNIRINPWMFDSIATKYRAAIMMHEIMHFARGHLFRENFLDAEKEIQRLLNIAGDGAINQYITDIPKGCSQCSHIPVGEATKPCTNKKCPGKSVDILEFKQENGQPFPPLKSMEEYFYLLNTSQERLKKEMEKQKQAGNKDEEQPDGDGSGNQEGKSDEPKQSGKGKSKYTASANPNDVHNDELLRQYAASKLTDQHGHEGDGEMTEEDKKDMLDAAKRIVRRTLEKTGYSAGKSEQLLKDLLIELDAMATKINHKALLRMAIRKTVCKQEKDLTWTRPNRRFGAYAQGKKMGDAPLIKFYPDTSGSISHREINQMLKVMDEFMHVGASKCIISLWADNIYHTRNHKKGKKFSQNELASGGTDITQVLEDISKKAPDLAVILTDGYYHNSYNGKLPTNIVWIITDGGAQEHPLRHVGKTINLKYLVDKNK